MRRRREEPKELDTGRVSLALRARRTDGGRFPFMPSPRRRPPARTLVLAAVLAAAALLLFLVLR